MADGYLEKCFDELNANKSGKTVVKRKSIDSLVKKNRSYRGYDKSFVVKRGMLERIVAVTAKAPSAKNKQVLRYRFVTKGEEADFVLQHIKLGGMLPELHLPYAGTEPEAFIIVCSTVPEDKLVDIDLGIAMQTMLLKATDMGLNGIIIGAYNKAKITERFNLPYEPLAIVAIGKAGEKIELVDANVGDNLAYYRKDGVHYVPKIKAEQLIIK